MALGVDSGSAHEHNVESETDMTEHDHENVKVGEDMGVYSGRKFVTLVSYCLAGEKKNSVKSAMQAWPSKQAKCNVEWKYKLELIFWM